MRHSVGRQFARLMTAFALALPLLAGCNRIDPPEKSKTLVIGIVAGPTTYQDEAGVVSGFEHDLLESFAASLGFKTRYVLLKDRHTLMEELKKGHLHLAAGAPIEAGEDLVFSLPIRESKQVLVGNVDDTLFNDDPPDLAGRTIEVPTGSPQAMALRKLAGTPPRFTVSEVAGSADRDLLQRVAEYKSALAASDTLNFSLALNYFPDLTIVMELPEHIRSGWAVTTENAALAGKANAFILAAKKDSSLARLQDRYFGHIQRIKADGVASFIDDIRTILPHYRKTFQAAQASTGLDWRLIAALAYQESKWDPLATSYTNVRGMMMLTEDTADRMHVDNRLDPMQSTLAGARYLLALKDELPDDVMEPDRTWLALAAYNLGMGHLNGARTFARQMKRDSTSWYDMKKVLPLMSTPEFYMRLKAGPARGGEAVILVENIRNYYDILCRFEAPWQPTPKLSFNLR